MSAERAIAVLLAFALGVLSPSAVAPLERPSWTVGDFWTYRTDTALLPGLTLAGTVTSTVEGRIPLVVAGSSVDAYRVLLTGSGTASGIVTTSSGTVSIQGAWVLTAEERFEPTNLDLVYNLLDLSVNGTYQNLVPFSLRLQNTTTYAIVSDAWRYPITVGMNGSQQVAYNFSQDFYNATGDLHGEGIGQWTLGFTMAAPTQVETPAGSFQAYPITQTSPDGSRTRSFASPQVGNDVRTESYDPGGNRTAVTNLTAYRYQALETSSFLGFGAVQWGALAAVVGAGLLAAVVWRRRRRTRPPTRGTTPPGVT